MFQKNTEKSLPYGFYFGETSALYVGLRQLKKLSKNVFCKFMNFFNWKNEQ